MRRIGLGILAVGFLISGFALAQDQAPGPDEDTPERGVARVSLMNGDVSVRRGDDGDWVAAAPNAPLVVQDHVLTGANSRAAIQFDWANFLRLSSDTEVRISELENKRYQVQVGRGTVMVSSVRDSDSDFEVDTPNVSIRPSSRSSVRITVRDEGVSEITVRSGEAEAYTPRGVERLSPGRTMLVRGSASDPEFQYVAEARVDDWDRWNRDQDRRLEGSRSYQYVSRDIYGADDLDSYGRWVYAPPYGWVWSPNGMAADWAPYRYGRWSWLDWYGWTWVSYDPWGWAPYHYGRWFYNAPYGWCWYPGAIHSRYYWRPALVAFFGFGHGVHVGIGFGNVGWVPLAPYEPYYPWYGRGYHGGYNRVNNITVINNTNITNVYRNARVAHGITGIDGADFARGGRGRAIELHNVEVQRASLVRGAVPVTPTGESLRVSDRQVRVTAPSRAVEMQRFAARRAAPAVQRVPFEQQRRGMEQTVARSFGQAPAANAMRGSNAPQQPAVRNEAGNAGWRTSGTAREQAPAGNAARGGNSAWRGFGTAPSRTERTPEAARQPAPEVRQSTQFPSRTERAQEPARQAAPEVRQSAPDRGRWQQFPSRTERAPEPAHQPAPEVRQPAPERGNWQQFPSQQRAPQTERARPEPRSEPRSEPRNYAPQRMDRGSSEPIHINPPIVRERGGGGGGGSYRAPESRGGGGGGAARSGGGGGERGGGGNRGGGGGGGNRGGNRR